MKIGAENRKKIIIAATLGPVALGCIIYAYSQLAGGDAPVPTAAPVVTTAPSAAKGAAGATAGKTTTTGKANVAGLGAAPGVDATKMASTSSSLDPTLDERAMLRTESLVYNGSGRNIFSLVYVPPPPPMPKNVPPPRPVAPVAAAPTGPIIPPPPPPINLKFFGTMTRASGQRSAFLLQGEDVYQALEGEIVARKYKIISVGVNSIQVEDLTNHNTQTLPLQVN